MAHTCLGRPWEMEELRRRTFDELHWIWWSCVKEINRLRSEAYTRRMLKVHIDEDISTKRIEHANTTQANIKKVLTERYYAWEDARKLAETDDEIDVVDDKVTVNETYAERLEREQYESEEEGVYDEEVFSNYDNRKDGKEYEDYAKEWQNADARVPINEKPGKEQTRLP